MSTHLNTFKSWRLTEEVITILVILVSFAFLESAFFEALRGLAITYLFICIGFRKYEAIQRKYH